MPYVAGLPDIDVEESARRSLFATHVAYGQAIPEALRAAGYSTTNLAQGFMLLSTDEVREQIDRHRKYIRDKQARGVNELVEQLDRDREFAIETRNASVAVAATLAQAKLLGALDPSLTIKAPKRMVIVWGGDETEISNVPAISGDREFSISPDAEDVLVGAETSSEEEGSSSAA